MINVGELWILELLDDDTGEETGRPVPPVDCNPDFEDDQGAIVYFSRDAAWAAADRQNEMYGIACHPVCIVAGAKPSAG